MEYDIKESILIGYPDVISLENTKKIIQQMEKNICKIKIGNMQGTGFFCKIPFPNKDNMLPVLITNNHVINENILFKEDEKISIYIEEKGSRNINLNNRKKYTDKEFDITIIEIKDKDQINNYLELDDSIIDNIINSINKNDKYKDETIYIIQYPDGKLSVSYGLLDKIYEDKKYTFNHKCSTKGGSSGSPILNLYTNKIIGIHKEANKNNYNKGTFLNYPIKIFIEQNNPNVNKSNESNDKLNNEIKNKEINNKFTNELKDKLNNKDINNKILNNGMNTVVNNKIKTDLTKEINNEINNKAKTEIKNKLNFIDNYFPILDSKKYEEKLNIMKENEDTITMIYDVNKSKKEKKNLKIFGEKFVENNKNIFFFFPNDKIKIIYKKKEYKFEPYFDINEIEEKNLVEIKLKGISEIKNKSYIFSGCENLVSLSNISDFITSKNDDISYMFNECKSLTSLPDISGWDTSEVNNINNLFSGCESLLSLPDISKWNISKVKDINHIFSDCKKLTSLPNISSWKTSNITQMNHSFYQCVSLKELPDISKWDTSNVISMEYMFYKCESLLLLPDISKWNVSKVKEFNGMFYGCKSLQPLSFDKIKNWSPKLLDDVSQWESLN